MADYYPAIYNDGVLKAGLDPARVSYDDAMGPIGTKVNSSSRFSDEERFINDLFKNGPDQITQRMSTIDACYASKTDQIVKLNDRSAGENIFVPTESGGSPRATIYRQYDMADDWNGGDGPHTSLKSIHNNWRRHYPADTAPTGEQDVIMRNQ